LRWSINLQAIENFIFGIRSIERKKESFHGQCREEMGGKREICRVGRAEALRITKQTLSAG
jgi:hypothetical protein